jgi:cellulose synthase/poly-beta-1,6-N-acetylglucosamine synthase-like glycosyltransferase
VTFYAEFIAGFFVAFVLVHTMLLVLAAFELRRAVTRADTSGLRRTLRSPLTPAISVLVPAFNEAAGICDSVRSLLALDYPKLEIVVISDGSTDETVERLIMDFGLREVRRPTPPLLPCEPVRALYVPRSKVQLLVIDKENGGKADSLNAGINFSTYPLLCSVDADSILEQDALAKTVLPFLEDPLRTVGSGGTVRIANGCKIDHGRVTQARLPRSRYAMFQVIEYLRAFFGTRTGWSALNSLLIVSGAFGLFRRDIVVAAGGYRKGTVGDDIELVVRLHQTCRAAGRPYRIVYVADPVCWTEGPEDTHDLRRQRRRWHRACLEMMIFHWRMLGNPRYGTVGLLALPSMLVFEVFGPVVELSGYVVTAIALALGILSPLTFVLLLVLAVLYGLVLTFGSIALEDATSHRFPGWDDLRRVLLYAVAENFGYRQLLHVWRIEGFWQLIHKEQWGAMPRKGLSRPDEPAGAAQPPGPDAHRPTGTLRVLSRAGQRPRVRRWPHRPALVQETSRLPGRGPKLPAMDLCSAGRPGEPRIPRPPGRPAARLRVPLVAAQRSGAHGHGQLVRGQRRHGKLRGPGAVRAQPVEHEGQVPAPDLRPDRQRVLGGRADHELDHRDVGGAQVGAQHPGVLGALHQRADHRQHAPARLLHHVAPVAGEHEDLAQATIAGHHHPGTLEEGNEPGPRVGIGEALLREPGQRVKAFGEQDLDQGLLVGKPPVHRAHPDARARRDVVERGLQPVLGEHLGRRLEDALPVALGVPAQRARRGRRGGGSGGGGRAVPSAPLRRDRHGAGGWCGGRPVRCAHAIQHTQMEMTPPVCATLSPETEMDPPDRRERCQRRTSRTRGGPLPGAQRTHRIRSAG